MTAEDDANTGPEQGVSERAVAGHHEQPFALGRFVAAWSIILAAGLVVGPIAGWCIAQLRGEDGGAAATVLVGRSPSAGLAAGVAVAAMALGAIAAGARLASVNVGLGAGGLVLAWAAARSGRTDELVLASTDGPWRMLAFEGLAWAMLVAAVCSVVWRVVPASHVRFRRSSSELGRVLVSLGVGFVAAAAAAWLIAAEPSRGQALAAATAAGVAAAVAARMVSVGVPRLVLLSVPTLLGIVVPTLMIVLPSDAGAIGAAVQRLSGLTPMDWLAGALLGVPIGAAWTESVAERAE